MQVTQYRLGCITPGTSEEGDFVSYPQTYSTVGVRVFSRADENAEDHRRCVVDMSTRMVLFSGGDEANDWRDLFVTVCKTAYPNLCAHEVYELACLEQGYTEEIQQDQVLHWMTGIYSDEAEHSSAFDGMYFVYIVTDPVEGDECDDSIFDLSVGSEVKLPNLEEPIAEMLAIFRLGTEKA